MIHPHPTEDKNMTKLAALKPSPYVPDWIVAQREDINEDMLSKLGIEYNPENDDNFEEDTEPQATV